MLNDYSYEIFDLQNIEEVQNIFQNPDVKGFNVTIPYKVAILPFLDEISAEAQEIGAVNTVKIFPDGRKKGFNTDAFGFEKTLNIHKKDFHSKALILGDGGAAKAIKYVLKQQNIPFQIVARKNDINFENLSAEQVQEHPLIIQATPVGTFPHIEDCLPFPFEALTSKHLIIDLIYNPNYTQFIKNAANFGAKTANGYFMLEQQAEKAWKIWNLE